jgi:hypothetical protein
LAEEEAKAFNFSPNHVQRVRDISKFIIGELWCKVPVLSLAKKGTQASVSLRVASVLFASLSNVLSFQIKPIRPLEPLEVWRKQQLFDLERTLDGRTKRDRVQLLVCCWNNCHYSPALELTSAPKSEAKRVGTEQARAFGAGSSGESWVSVDTFFRDLS